MPKNWNATKVKGGMDEENTWAEALVGEVDSAVGSKD